MDKIDHLAQIIWNYSLMNHNLVKSDVIWVVCSNHLIVAHCAAKLFMDGWAPKIIYSGGEAHQNDMLNTGWGKPEAEVFCEIGIKAGIPVDKIIIENKATNTGENIRFTYEIIKDMNFRKIILVQKPFMERRTYATFMKQWPGEPVDFMVTSPQLTIEQYIKLEKVNKDDLINFMVGDLQRIKVYPEKGFQIYQEIPDEVWSAWESLVELGYDKHLITG